MVLALTALLAMIGPAWSVYFFITTGRKA